MFTIDKYTELTGICIPANQQIRVNAQIRKSLRILEQLLGFSLDPDELNTNQYAEEGKSTSDFDCSCCMNDDPVLDPADPVIFAYRLFPYNRADKYLSIDPCSDVYAVKLVKNGVTYRTFETSEYGVEFKRGIIKFLHRVDCWCLCVQPCNCVQLAVDAQWLWPDDQMPEDLMDVLCEMTTYYSNQKSNIKSETLGSHSYTKFANTPAEQLDHNLAVIKKYAGPLGTVSQMPV